MMKLNKSFLLPLLALILVSVSYAEETTAPAPRSIRFNPIATGRYLKVIIKSTQSQNDPAAGIAELGIIE